MTTRLLICLTLWSLYMHRLPERNNRKNRTQPHTRGTSDSSIPRRPSFIIGKTELQSQRTNTP